MAMTGLSTVVFVGTAFNLALPIFTLFKGTKKRINLVFFALGMSVAPVSYTHLDVYKRQALFMDVSWPRSKTMP